MTPSTPSNLLKSMPCFTDLGPEVMEWVAGVLRERSFAKEETVILEGEPCPGLFIVKLGSVRLYRSSADGEEQIVRIARQGECLECVPLFDGGSSMVSARALEASEVYVLSAADFDTLLNTHHRAASIFTLILARRLRSLVGMVGDFSMRRVYPRLAGLLCQLSEWREEELVVSPSAPLTQYHLACMLGCSRQIVNNSLRRLVREGIIKIEARRITILQPEALKEKIRS